VLPLTVDFMNYFAVAKCVLKFTLIVSDEHSDSSRITRKDTLPDEDVKGTENVCTLHVVGPDLPIPASPRTPDNMATVRKYCSH
jgi:hypothetical protein